MAPDPQRREQRLGEIMIERGLLTEQQLTDALAEQRRNPRPLGEVLVGLGYASSAAVSQALAKQNGWALGVDFGLGARLPRHLHAVPQPPGSAEPGALTSEPAPEPPQVPIDAEDRRTATAGAGSARPAFDELANDGVDQSPASAAELKAPADVVDSGRVVAELAADLDAEGEGRQPAPREAADAPARAREHDPEARRRVAFESAEERTRRLAAEIDQVQAEIRRVRAALANASRPAETWEEKSLGTASPLLVRIGVLALLAGLLMLSMWARAVNYPLRVTSDTPTFIALVADMAERPFASQSPFLPTGVSTQHATPYIQALAYLWRLVGGHAPAPIELGRLLAVVGIGVFAFLLACVFLYARRLAGSLAAWIALPALLCVFGPPNVIWASDLSLHGALYAGFFPQNLAIALALLTLLALGRHTMVSLVLSCALAALTMLVHPFTGVLLCVLATTESCRLAARGDRAAARAPIALAGGFALGAAWPAYSLDKAFAETGLRGVAFIALCAAAPLVALALPRLRVGTVAPRTVSRLGGRLETGGAALVLAVVGTIGTSALAAWELVLVKWPPPESARLAIYWVDGRWRWPLLLVAGTVGLSGLARLARRGHVVPAVWFAGCFTLGTLGALGLPLPVWYRFLLLCQIPLAIGVAVVIADSRRSWTTALVVGAFALTLSVKLLTLVAAPATVTYFGQPLQPAWSLGEHVPRGRGIVATDPSTAYFIPATTGRRVLTVGRGHVSSNRELAISEAGYRLLRRYYAGGRDWWQAGQQMWRRGVRYVIVEKQTTLEPKNLTEFIWQNALLHTDAQRRALGNYYYENNRVGTLVYDSFDYAIYRLDRNALFGRSTHADE
jgi:hypothetical protein